MLIWDCNYIPLLDGMPIIPFLFKNFLSSWFKMDVSLVYGVQEWVVFFFLMFWKILVGRMYLHFFSLSKVHWTCFWFSFFLGWTSSFRHSCRHSWLHFSRGAKVTGWRGLLRPWVWLVVSWCFPVWDACG